MSDTDVSSDRADGYEERPSFLPPPTFPASMTADGDAEDGGPVDTAAPPVPVAPPADEQPARSGLLIRLGHLFCGRPNGAR